MQRHCGFRSFVQGGFECSSHYRRDGTRLDLIASTCHDRFVKRDYRVLREHGMRTCRDGLRWHLIEATPGRYDFSSFLPMLRAAVQTGMQPIWDLCHYGWPDHIDIFAPDFPERFARYAHAVARVVAAESPDVPYFSPMNEISFFSWAGGEVALIGPFTQERGLELKKQLVRATIAAIDAVRSVSPHARFVQVDPLVNIVTDATMTEVERTEARAYCAAQYQGWDMLVGRVFPELGGRPEYLDIIGCNYYVHNQWVYGGPFIERSDPRYRPLWQMLREVHSRYDRPLFLAETGIENERRPLWFRYICDEISTCLANGVPVEGVCLYPVVNHPGWDDDRHCHNGLLDYCNGSGHRDIYIPLADEIARQQTRLAGLLEREPAVASAGRSAAESNQQLRRIEMKLSERSVTAMPRDLVCLSHLRWGFVYQRPQHLLSRFARNLRVFFVEEPIATDGTPTMDLHVCPETGVNIVVPRIPANLGAATQNTIQKLLLNNFVQEQGILDYTLWYYTPMALSFSSHLTPALTIFDCMDELSAFKGAPQEMKDREAELMRRADLVFTGGQSLYEAKVGRHDDLHAFPSSIEFAHFAQARTMSEDPADQAGIPHPRVGFAGVIDERMDIDLVGRMAELRPDLHFVMVGPVVKIDPESLPKRDNIHYLGGKSYKELPAYLAGWDVAMLPFAHNHSTKYISPTKTPEYLAAGKPCVSTSITDVVRPYGVQRLVRIADDAPTFIEAIDAALQIDARDPDWAERRDAFLAQNSWDITWRKMLTLMENKVAAREYSNIPSVASLRPVQTALLGD